MKYSQTDSRLSSNNA